MNLPIDYLQRIEDDGFAVVESVVSPEQTAALRAAIEALPAGLQWQATVA